MKQGDAFSGANACFGVVMLLSRAWVCMTVALHTGQSIAQAVLRYNRVDIPSFSSVSLWHRKTQCSLINDVSPASPRVPDLFGITAPPRS